MKKRLLALMMAGVMAFGLTACGSASSSSKKAADKSDSDKKLTVWAWDESFNIPAAKDAVEIYKKDNPDVNVDVVTMAQDDIVAKLNTALAAKNYDGLPDVVLIEDYRIQNYLTAYKDEFADLSSVVKPSDFAAYKTGVDQVDGKMYGVPFDSGVAALFYRTDLVEKAGYKAEDMKDLTWEKYIEIGKAVKEKCGVDWLTLDPSDLGQIRMMLQSAGSWYTDKDGKVDVKDNETLKAAIGVYKQLMEAGFVKQTSNWDQFVGAFNKGDVASVFTGCWIVNSIKNGTDQSGKWAATNFPKFSNVSNAVNASSIGGAGWYVLKNVGHEKLAVDFLGKTFGSSKDLMFKLGDEIALVSTLNAASGYSKKDDFFGGQDLAADFVNWTSQVPTVNYGKSTYTIEDIMTEAVQNIMKGADVDDTLKSYQTQIESAVAQ